MSEAPIQLLLVEDNPADAALFRAALANVPHTRFALTNSQRLAQALARLDQERFDAILLDLGLPDSQGLATLEEVQKHAHESPVIVLTGLDDEATAVKALREGAQDYLLKGEAVGSMMARAIRYAIERKRADESARARETELAHLSRVSTMGQMASGLAHELNQPLAAILNYASVCLAYLESGTGTAERGLTALRELMNETRRAGAIISRLRSFVRKQQPQAVPVDINELVEESLGILDFELRHQQIRPTMRLARDLPRVLADRIQIEQVLVNLIYNALEAIAPNRSPRNGLAVQTTLLGDTRTIQICVIDSGPGVPPDVLDRLFEPFFSTKSHGLGMGLNISRTIIESHGGTLTGAPNTDGGMKFCFTLPVAEGEAA